jgi:rod shape-determining protein MreD
MRPALATFLAGLALWILVAQANHALAGAHVYLFVGGLLVAPAALVLPLPSGLAVTLLLGGVCDANSLAPFGTHLLLFATVHAVLCNLRDRLPHEETTGRVVIALFANLALFLALSFLAIDRSPAPGAAWLRLFADLACSQVALAVLAPWYFALQARAQALAEPAAAWR